MKIVKITFLLIFFALVIGVFYIFSNLNTLVKQGVEEVGSDVFKTSVSLGKVDISLLENRARLSGLKVANLPGFNAANIFELDDVVVDLKVSSLLQKVVEVENITINGARIVAEQQGLATNLQALQKNLDTNSDVSAPAEEESNDQSSPAEVLIKVGKFQFSNNQVTLITDKWGERGLTIPTIELKDIGGSTGVSPEGLAEAVTKPLLKKIGRAVEDNLKEITKEKAKEKLREKEDEAKEKATKKIEEKLGEGSVDKLKSLFGR